MPRYTTSVEHDLGKDAALARLRAALERARSFSDLSGGWEGDTFTFSVSLQGVRIQGSLAAEEDRLTFDGKLPLLAMPFRNWIPRMLRKSLEWAREPEVRAEADTPPAILFLHIPKAGGQTLGEFIYAHARAAEGTGENGVLVDGVAYLSYGFFKERPLEVPGHALPLLQRPDLRAVIGHFWFGLHEHVARPAVYVTALRNPVERVVSLYHYARLQDSLSLDEFVAEPPFPEVDNDQTRRLAGADPEIGACTPAMLATAKENLRRCAVAGTIERLDDTLVLLRRRFGWHSPFVSEPRNVNPDRPPLSALAPATVAAIRARNELDWELWRYASELMDEELRRAS